jgi:hypothetical protein
MQGRRPSRLGLHTFGALVLFLMPLTAAATPTGARYHRPPPLGDDYLAWTQRSIARLHAQDLGDFSPFKTDADWVNEYLADPGSVYSDLHPRLFSQGREGLEQPGEFPESKRTGRIIAWDLGLDKALPGFQVLSNYPGPTRGDMRFGVAANMEKADVLPRYFNKAYELSNSKLFALNAELAVAVQILHEWVEATPWADRLNLGIEEDVLVRFEAAQSLDDLGDHDLTYLADLLRSELSTWRAGGMNSLEHREIRTPLRIARVAAAYRATLPGYTGCNADGSKNARAGDHPEDLAHPLCFSDATDRAVYRWYRATRDYQLGQMPEAFDNFDKIVRLIDVFGDVRPAWAGAYTGKALDWSNHAEVVEAQMALSLDYTSSSEISFYRLVERANLLICRRSTP